MEGSLQFLHLEDDPLDAELIQENLVAWGFDCDIVRVQTRQEFLAATETRRLDVILADFSLPSFDGLSALTIAQEKCPDVPFIFVSGAIGEEMAIETLRKGATDYVLKDRLPRLGPAVRRALSEVEERNRRRQATEELRQSQGQLEAILQGITEGIIVQKPDGSLLYANPAGARLSGFTSPKELLEMSVPEVVARFEMLDEQGQPFPLERLPGRRTLRGEHPEEVVLRIRFHETGEERWLIVNASPVYDHEGQIQFAISIFRDITERMHMFEAERRARAQAELAQQRLEFLSQASSLLASSLDFEATLNRVTQLAVPEIADWCAVDLIQDDGTTRRVAVAHVDVSKAELAFELERRFPRDPQAPAGLPKVLRTGLSELYSVVSESLLQKITFAPEHRQLVQQLGFSSAIVVPLKVRDQVIGALTLVAAGSGRQFNEADVSLAEELAQRAAIAVDNARLYREATLLNEELEQRVAKRTEELQESNRQLEKEIHQHQMAEMRFRSLLEAAPDAMVIVNQQGEIVLVNSQTETIFGYSRDELLGQPVEMLLPESLRWQHIDHRARYQQEPRRRPMGEGLDLFGRRRDGSLFPAEISLSPLMTDEGILIITVLRDITERKEAEEMTQALLRRQQELSRKVVSAQEEERQRLSRELHDSAGQILTALHLNLSMLASQVDGNQDLYNQIIEAVEMTRIAQEEIRAASHALRPPALDTLGLNETLKSLCRDFARQANLQIAYEGVDVPTLSEQVSISFYRFLQETLTNVAKHARASVVKVNLNYDGYELRLAVEDNGVGMLALNQQLFAAGRAGGVGLLGLRERFELIGGAVAVESWPEKGTRVAARYPMQN